jgi:transposase-like protein
MHTYSKTFKEEIIKKALSNTTGLKDLAQAVGIPYATLYSWIRTKKMKADDEIKEKNAPSVRPQNWSADAKLQAIIETASMTQEEIGAYCRQKGLYPHHLQAWRQRCVEGMKSSAGNKVTGELHQLKTELHHLKSELHRKDKALAEASALLILKKKADLIWGDSEDA